MKRRPFATYDQAARAAQSLGVTQAREYQQRYREIPGLPSSPYKTYAMSWKGWYDFLHTTPKPMPSRRRTDVLSLDEAAAAAREAGLTTYTKYRKGHVAVPGLHSNPDAYYPDWPGWPAFFGIVRQRSGPFVALESFPQVMRELGVTSKRSYDQRYRERPDLPARPDRHYESWPGWATVLGTGRVRRVRATPPGLTYQEASALARRLGWRSARAYVRGRGAYPGLPGRPAQTYRSQWAGWPVFLGTRTTTSSRKSPRFTLTMREASDAARQAGFATLPAYLDGWHSIPGLPEDPKRVYPDWPGWPAFLGL